MDVMQAGFHRAYNEVYGEGGIRTLGTTPAWFRCRLCPQTVSAL